MKVIGYVLFAIIYNICKLFPVNHFKVLCIMTHDDGPGSNVFIVQKELKKRKQYTFSYITKTETEMLRDKKHIGAFLRYFFCKPYELATSRIILMDNIFLPMAYVKRRSGVICIQLWHGTGTIKKFGQDSTKGKLHQQEYRANQFMTHLIVNSEAMITLYAKAFGVDIDKVYPLGLPKTDEIVKKASSAEKLKSAKDKLCKELDIQEGTRLILYAPTFRDEEVHAPKQISHIRALASKLSDNDLLLVRLHPHVARAYKGKLPERVLNVSFYKDLTGLLLASDMLITDYSSIIFEYCLLHRKMIFYAYDLEVFEDNGRGFYEPYGRFVPGNIVTNCDDLLKEIENPEFDVDKLEDFILKNYHYMDGEAVTRICELIKQN